MGAQLQFESVGKSATGRYGTELLRTSTGPTISDKAFAVYVFSRSSTIFARATIYVIVGIKLVREPFRMLRDMLGYHGHVWTSSLRGT